MMEKEKGACAHVCMMGYELIGRASHVRHPDRGGHPSETTIDSTSLSISSLQIFLPFSLLPLLHCAPSCRLITMVATPGPRPIPIPGPTSPQSSLIASGQRYLLFPSFTLESGTTITNVPVAYKTWGTLNPTTKNNALVVCHALTGSADVEDW